MAEATDKQMQQFCDERIRVRAEQLRTTINACRDDKASLDSVYERAVGQNPWNDNRNDGSPKLLTSQDVLVYNSVVTLFLKCIDGTATLQDISDLHANWPVFQSACVRPVT